MKIITATNSHVDILTPLFDQYRVFYKQNSNLETAKAFLLQRINRKDSIIFLAVTQEEKAMGFTQLYPSYSSVSMQQMYILNDLFVAQNYRNKGVGEALLNHAKTFAKAKKSKGIVLETAIDNPANNLYKRLGWLKDTTVNHYTWKTHST